LSSDLHILGGRRWVPRGVIVSDDDCCAIALDSVSEDLGYSDMRRIETADVDCLGTEEAVTGVEV
jgi:hypothetical protein